MTEPATDTARRRRALWARWVFVASITGAVVIMAMSLPRSDPIVAATGVIPPPPSELAYSDQPAQREAQGAGNPMRALLGGSGGADPSSLLIGPDAEPLTEPPAGLAVYQGARLLLGQQRRDAHWLEQQAVYAAKGASVEAVAAFYEAEAARAGFTLKPTAGATAADRIFVSPTGVLQMRAREADDEVRITLILRATVKAP